MAEEKKKREIKSHKGGRTISTGLRFSPSEKALLERLAVGGLSQADVIVFGLKIIANMPEAERVESLKKLL